MYSSNKKSFILGFLGMIPFILAIPFCKTAVPKPSKELNQKIEEIELAFVAWACYCPKWVELDKLEEKDLSY